MADRRVGPVSYPHRFRVATTAVGVQDDDTGAYTPGSETVLYDGFADVQDEGETMRRDADGRPLTMSEGVIYLEDEAAVATLSPGLPGVVTWEDGSTSDAEILRAVRLDGKLHVRWL